MRSDLAEALKNDELQVLFAPMFNLDSGIATHMDVLMKWEHPEHGTLYSPDIMPIADQCGLSNKVCRHAVSQAIEAAANWPEDVQLCINFHPSRFGNGHLVKHLIDTCERVGLEPGRLCIGLKESPNAGGNAAVISDLKELGMFGIKLAISNLGGGDNSWQVLQDVEIDLIIVSPSFIRNFQATPQRAAVLCAMSNLAEGLGIPIAAAGIEQNDQGKLLKLAGITHGMGDALAAPLSASEFTFPLMQDQVGSDESTTIEISA